jgi:hypothetical protein
MLLLTAEGAEAFAEARREEIEIGNYRKGL